MPDRKGGVRSPWWWARVGLAVIVGIGLSWLVLTAGAPRAFPGLAARLAPERIDTQLLFRSAGERLLSGGELPPETFPRLGEAARTQPLAHQPFLFFGVRALGQGNIEEGERLLLEARRRDPRDEFARLLLVSTYLQTGRVAPAAREIESLLRIMPTAREILIPELARLAADPRNRPALIQAIGDSPLMAALLQHLVLSGADPDLTLALAARQPVATDGRFNDWQTSILEQLSERGEVRRAYGLWQRFLGRPDAAPAPVYDPQFEGLPGPPPFNWRLAASQVGSAEFVSGPAMEVEFFGRESGVLASQLLLLSPGAYQFAIEGEGDASGEGSRLVWRVRCRPGDRTLLELPVEEVTYTPKRLTGRFEVPAGCGAQQLELVGVAAEFPTVQSVRFAGLEIERAGASR